MQELPRIQEDTIPVGMKGKRERIEREEGRKEGKKEGSKEEQTPANARRAHLPAFKELALRNMDTTTLEHWFDS